MRKPSIFIILLAIGLLGVSCDDKFFDTLSEERLTMEQTFSKKATTEQFLANVYSYVPDEFSQRFVSGTAGPWTGGSSEAEFVWSFVESQKVNNGSIDPTSDLTKKYWTEFYKGINKASTFMEWVDKCQELGNDRTLRKAEARVLRAYFYFNLLKIYGPFVIIGEKALPQDAPFELVQLPRNSIDECVEYINSELLLAARDLPEVPNSKDYGRITRPIALAFRSKLLLYAASPLFNGNEQYKDLQNADGKKLFPQTFEQAKWDSAYAATKTFIDTYVPSYFNLNAVGTDGKPFVFGSTTNTGKYDPYISYREVVRGNDYSSNPELIFYRIACNVSAFQYELTPFHNGAPNNDYKGSGGKSITQEMVDMYFTNNGLRVDEDPAYKTSGFSTKAYNNPFNTSFIFAPLNTYNQWVNREPRFYADVTFNGSIWLNTNPSKIVTTTYFNGNSGKNIGGNDYPVTGYIVRKGAPLGAWGSGSRSCVLLRLAEIYLNYAEACNETGRLDEAIKYVNLIRQRAGVPEYGNGGGVDSNGFTRIPYPATKDDIRNRIRRERTIELAFENQRYFDVRRWKVADMPVGDGWVYPTYHEGGEGGDYHGLDVSQDPPTKFFQKVVFEKRAFTAKHYFFPIPQNELNIDKKLVQNTGWETNVNAQ